MRTAKVTSVGEFIGIELPSELVAHLRLTVGDELRISENSSGIQLNPCRNETISQLTVAKKVMAEDRDVLQKLAE